MFVKFNFRYCPAMAIARNLGGFGYARQPVLFLAFAEGSLWLVPAVNGTHQLRSLIAAFTTRAGFMRLTGLVRSYPNNGHSSISWLQHLLRQCA